MNIEDQNNQNVDNSRRGFTKLGVAAPVLMSLASRPVFGGGGHGAPAACLSGMLSGNASHAHEESCRFGWSPGGWANPVGTIDGLDTLSAWEAAGFHHGGGAPNDACPVSGSTVQDMKNSAAGLLYPPEAAGAAALFLSGSNPNDTLVCVLKPPTNMLDRACITAYLNASLMTNYILSPVQVVMICTGFMEVPGGLSAQDFLDGTWNGDI